MKKKIWSFQKKQILEKIQEMKKNFVKDSEIKKALMEEFKISRSAYYNFKNQLEEKGESKMAGKQLKWKFMDMVNLDLRYVSEEKLKKLIYTQLDRFKELYADLDANKANFSLDKKYLQVWLRDQQHIFNKCWQIDIDHREMKHIIKGNKIVEANVGKRPQEKFYDAYLWDFHLCGEDDLTKDKSSGVEFLDKWLEINTERLEFCLENLEYAKVLLKCCFFEA